MLIFDTPTSTTLVRNGVFAYRYKNGLVLIEKQRYYGYTIKQAIKKWRLDNKLKN